MHMLVYWSFVLIPMLLSLTERVRRRSGHVVLLLPLLAALLLLMGLRETAGDFSTYLSLYESLQDEPLPAALAQVEPIYGFLNWLSARFDLGIYGVNSMCAVIFLYCLYRAARKEALPFLFTALAIPYFVIVVGMGYTRQGVAAALVMLGVVELRERHLLRFFLAVILAAGFHYSAFAALALALVVRTGRLSGVMLLISRVLLVAALVFFVRSLLHDQLDAYAANYIESDRYQSGGAFLRSSVTGTAGIAFFCYRTKFKALYDDYAIWKPFAVVALLSVPLSLVASTPTDRMGLYLLPFQIVTFSRLPLVIRKGRSLQRVRLFVLSAYVAYFFVWLQLGSFASELWLPYRWVWSS